MHCRVPATQYNNHSRHIPFAVFELSAPPSGGIVDVLYPASPLFAGDRPGADDAHVPAGAEELSVMSLQRPSADTTALFTICLSDAYPASV